MLPEDLDELLEDLILPDDLEEELLEDLFIVLDDLELLELLTVPDLFDLEEGLTTLVPDDLLVGELLLIDLVDLVERLFPKLLVDELVPLTLVFLLFLAAFDNLRVE